MEESGIKPEDLKLSDKLAVERTVLAADRTMLAGVRTSLSFIGFGFTIFNVLRYVQEHAVAQLHPGVAGHRVRIPAEIHPYSSGIKGGIVGGIAMAIVACLYGVIAYRSIWYPINLLAAAAVPSLARADLAQLTAFNGTGFIVALISHGLFSILVGLLFAVLLPMLPSRRAAFWGSLVSPILWSALIWATLRLINPALNARIDWIWFIASQVAFGMVTGYIVHHSKMVETMWVPGSVIFLVPVAVLAIGLFDSPQTRSEPTTHVDYQTNQPG